MFDLLSFVRFNEMNPKWEDKARAEDYTSGLLYACFVFIVRKSRLKPLLQNAMGPDQL